jgi:hypothetical protein
MSASSSAMRSFFPSMSKKPPQLGELAAQNIESLFFFSKHKIPFERNKAWHYSGSGGDEQANSCQFHEQINVRHLSPILLKRRRKKGLA